MAVTSLKRSKAPDPVFVLRGHRTDTTAVTFPVEGNLLLSGDADGEVKLWDLNTRRPVSSVRGHSAHAGVIGLAASRADSSTFLSQGRDGVVKVWALGESGLARQPLMVIETGSYNFCKLAIAKAPQISLDHSQTHLSEQRDGQRGRPASARVVHGESEAIVESPGASTTCLADDMESMENCPDPQSEAQAAAPAPEAVEKSETRASQERPKRRRGGLAAALGPNGPGQLMELQSNGQESVADAAREADGERTTSAGTPPSSSAVDYPNELIALAGADPSAIEIWDARSGRLIQRLEQPRSRSGRNGVVRTDTPSAGMCMSVQLCPGSDTCPTPVAVGGYEDGSLMAWDLRSTGAPVIRHRLHTEPVLSLALEASGKGGLSGSADDKLTFFSLDYEEGQCVAAKEVGLERPGIGDIALRDDQRIVATAGWDHRVRIFDYKRRTPLAVLRYHAAAVTAVSFSRDGRFLASASRDASVALWSVYPPTTDREG